MQSSKAFILLFFIAGKMNAQENNQWKELVLKVPVMNEYSIATIGKQLSCFEGLHFSGYVRAESCLLVRYDNNKILDPFIIAQTIHYLNYRIPVNPIKNCSFYDVIDGKGMSK